MLSLGSLLNNQPFTIWSPHSRHRPSWTPPAHRATPRVQTPSQRAVRFEPLHLVFALAKPPRAKFLWASISSSLIWGWQQTLGNPRSPSALGTLPETTQLPGGLSSTPQATWAVLPHLCLLSVLPPFLILNAQDLNHLFTSPPPTWPPSESQGQQL